MADTVSAVASVAMAVYNICQKADEHDIALQRIGKRVKDLNDLINMWELNKTRAGKFQHPTQATLSNLRECLQSIQQIVEKGNRHRNKTGVGAFLQWLFFTTCSGNPNDLESEAARLDSLLSDVALANDIQTLNRVDAIYDLLQQQAPISEQTRLRKMMDDAQTIQDLKRVYDEQAFVDLVDRVAAAQADFGDPWVWSVCWANARQQQQDWARSPEESRRTALKLLQTVYNKHETEMESPHGPSRQVRTEIFGSFKPEAIARILKIFLPMEKANAFYKMNEGKGIHWYCKAFPEERQRAGVPENDNKKGALNKRYVYLYLYGNQYLAEKGMPRMGGDANADFIERFFVPEACPTTNHAPQAPAAHLPMVLPVAPPLPPALPSTPVPVSPAHGTTALPDYDEYDV